MPTPPARTTRCWDASASPRSCSTARSRPVLFRRPAAGRQAISASRSTRSMCTIWHPRTIRFHGYRTDIQWNNTVHLNDLFTSSVLTATDLTFGYECIGDTANVKANSVSGGFPFAQRRERIDDDESRLCRHSDDAVAAPDADGTGAPGCGAERFAVHLAAWRGAGRAGGSHALQGRLRHRLPRAVPVRPVRLRFNRLVGNPNLQPETAQGWEAGFTTDLPVFARADGISFGATYFNEQIQNLIVEQFVPIETAGEHRFRAHPGRRDIADTATVQLDRRSTPPTPSPMRRMPTTASGCCADHRTRRRSMRRSRRCRA